MAVRLLVFRSEVVQQDNSRSSRKHFFPHFFLRGTRRCGVLLPWRTRQLWHLCGRPAPFRQQLWHILRAGVVRVRDDGDDQLECSYSGNQQPKRVLVKVGAGHGS